MIIETLVPYVILLFIVSLTGAVTTATYLWLNEAKEKREKKRYLTAVLKENERLHDRIIYWQLACDKLYKQVPNGRKEA